MATPPNTSARSRPNASLALHVHPRGRGGRCGRRGRHETTQSVAVRRERNRIAASKCRTRSMQWQQNLENQVRDLREQNAQLATAVSALKEELLLCKEKLVLQGWICAKVNETSCDWVKEMVSLIGVGDGKLAEWPTLVDFDSQLAQPSEDLTTISTAIIRGPSPTESDTGNVMDCLDEFLLNYVDL